jgi:hypothetical protein
LKSYGLRDSSGSFAMFAAILRASSLSLLIVAMLSGGGYGLSQRKSH